MPQLQDIDTPTTPCEVCDHRLEDPVAADLAILWGGPPDEQLVCRACRDYFINVLPGE